MAYTPKELWSHSGKVGWESRESARKRAFNAVGLRTS
jgi:hypothetical protein